MRALPRLVAAISLSLLAIGLAIAVPTAEAASTVKVLQLNICHSGIAGCYAGAEPVLAKAESVIASTRPQVVSVNEACEGDVPRLRAAVGDAVATFVAAEHRDGAPVTCTNGQRYGNILLVATALAGGPAATGRYAAQDGSDEMRVWACLPAGALSACTTHLSARSGTTALAQCQDLMARAAGYAAGGPVVVAGDLNLRYHGSPDAQSCNRTGFYRKGDGEVQHVFATTSLSFVSGTKIDMAGTTDHPGWLVTVTMG
jgi:endonuclease/exonuclease/phosphatase family metal-dependent hydrolase